MHGPCSLVQNCKNANFNFYLIESREVSVFVGFCKFLFDLILKATFITKIKWLLEDTDLIDWGIKFDKEPAPELVR